MHRIEVMERWHDWTGQYRSDIVIDGRLVASVYSLAFERMLVHTLAADQRCEVWRSARGVPAHRVEDAEG